MTVSCGFFMGEVQNMGCMVIKLTGLTFDLAGKINFNLKEGT